MGCLQVLSLECDATDGGVKLGNVVWCRIQGFFFQQCTSVSTFGILKIHSVLLPTCLGDVVFVCWEPRCPNVERASKYVGRLNRTWREVVMSPVFFRSVSLSFSHCIQCP